ncbi:MAG: hypothetical protein IKY22_01260 [Bacteroidales bacterium]|nr:hypothetical protein [Bacteroidales bacterium]
MGNRSFLSFFFPLLMFVIFGAISCFATSESLYLTFDGAFPRFIWVAIVIGFYIITSLGTKWIIESFSSDFQENRRLKLFGGLLIVLVFWLAVSFPTNAHTFLYKRAAKTVAQKEIAWQDKELYSIIDVKAWAYDKEAAINKQVAEIETKKEALIGEMNNPDHKGFAHRAEKILLEIEDKLGIAKGSIPRTKARNFSGNEMNRLNKHYSNAISDQLVIYKSKLQKDLAVQVAIREKEVERAKDTKKRLEAMIKALDDNRNVNEAMLKEARSQINNAYNILDKYTITGETSYRTKYVEDEKGLPSHKLTNAGEIVYKDYLKGQLNKKYDIQETKSMIYFILISLMIDIAAFLFFNIAFKSNRNNYSF